jgi:antitoxin VapB
MRSRLLKSGNSVAVRIPKALRFDALTGYVEVTRQGGSLVITPERRPLTKVLKKFKAFSTDFMSHGRQGI